VLCPSSEEKEDEGVRTHRDVGPYREKNQRRHGKKGLGEFYLLVLNKIESADRVLLRGGVVKKENDRQERGVKKFSQTSGRKEGNFDSKRGGFMNRQICSIQKTLEIPKEKHARAPMLGGRGNAGVNRAPGRLKKRKGAEKAEGIKCPRGGGDHGRLL